MGGMGRERIHNMKHDFKFISKHSPQVKSAYSDLMEILSLVHDDLRKQYTFQHEPVGSYSRNKVIELPSPAVPTVQPHTAG